LGRALAVFFLLGEARGQSGEHVDAGPKRYAALSGRTLDPHRIAILREEGAIAIGPDGRLRVTQDGFPVLDAVVADLAA
jgi:hypothetical protein